MLANKTNIAESAYHGIRKIIKSGYYKDITLLEVSRSGDCCKQRLVDKLGGRNNMLTIFFKKYNQAVRSEVGTIDIKDMLKFLPYFKGFYDEPRYQFMMLMEQVCRRFANEQDVCSTLGKSMLSNLGL